MIKGSFDAKNIKTLKTKVNRILNKNLVISLLMKK
jgi:hypothetical protein